jgi:hypothetical protein
MKFSGKELFNLGIPQNKIKLFVNREFENLESLFNELNKQEVKDKEVTGISILEFIWKHFKSILPWMNNGDLPVKMSKSELKRVMDNSGLLFNGRRPNSKDVFDLDADFPIKELIWFPNSKEKKTTWI